MNRVTGTKSRQKIKLTNGIEVTNVKEQSTNKN